LCEPFSSVELIAVMRRTVFAIPGSLTRMPSQIIVSGADARQFYTARPKPWHHPRFISPVCFTQCEHEDAIVRVVFFILCVSPVRLSLCDPDPWKFTTSTRFCIRSFVFVASLLTVLNPGIYQGGQLPPPEVLFAPPPPVKCQ
jgi:hypothetical protein